MKYTYLQAVDPEIYDIIKSEEARQRDGLELIASENFVSEAVIEAAGSVLTNKYAEGYPDKRYYGGCHIVDKSEQLAIDRLKKLFNADHANVQPHAGANANFGVYLACLKPGDTVLGMDLSNGGHLTHGSPVNMSGLYFNFVSYKLNPKTEMLDYDNIRELALQHKPKLIVAGASAYPRKIDFAKFREIADEVDALLMVDMAHIAGLVAAGLHMNPCEYADYVTTTTHKTLRGPRGGAILCKAEHAKKLDKAIFPGLQGGPLEHIIAAKAVAFHEALQPEFKTYQEQIIKNANKLAEELVKRGIKLVSGGTDNHMMLIDLGADGLSGKEVEAMLGDIEITVNKNTVPNETRSPFVTSGIRIGTPAVTTRGLVEEDMVELADIIASCINQTATAETLKGRVKTLCEKYPLYNK